jgi:hypothetical protein
MSDVKTCKRSEELIGFLYGELSELEARRFERHLHECAACETELAAFSGIRQSIVEWRDETVGLAALPSAVPSEVNGSSVILQPQRSGKSAIVALREFFALSPVWLKGVTAFASVLFCICAVLAVSYLKNRPTAVNISDSNNQPKYTEAQVKAEVSKAVSDAVARTRDEMLARQEAASPKEERRPRVPGEPRRSTGSGEDLARSSRRPFTTQERQELAADLRLIRTKDEDDLDFSSDANRPTP